MKTLLSSLGLAPKKSTKVSRPLRRGMMLETLEARAQMSAAPFELPFASPVSGLGAAVAPGAAAPAAVHSAAAGGAGAAAAAAVTWEKWTWDGNDAHYLWAQRNGSQFIVYYNSQYYYGTVDAYNRVNLPAFGLNGWIQDGSHILWWNKDQMWEKTRDSGFTADWFDLKIGNDYATRAIVHTRYSIDRDLSRKDMMDIFTRTQADGTIYSTELNALKNTVYYAYAGGNDHLNMADDVRNLSHKVVNGDAANARYRGGNLGNLAAGSRADQLDKLVHKWFLGDDRPQIAANYQYATASLFGSGIRYTDIQQGQIGDCYFLASLATTAAQKPQTIQSMFKDNGDGTFTVRFFRNGASEYVTVDRYLPVDSAGRLICDGMGRSVRDNNQNLWAQLAEKAYAQINESGWLNRPTGTNGRNSYDAISGGWGNVAIAQITGLRTAFDNSLNFNTLVNSVNSGKMVVLHSMVQPRESLIVSNHAYALIGYNAATQRFTLFNPWGTVNSRDRGFLYSPWGALITNFNTDGRSLAAPEAASAVVLTTSALGEQNALTSSAKTDEVVPQRAMAHHDVALISLWNEAASHTNQPADTTASRHEEVVDSVLFGWDASDELAAKLAI